MRNGRTRTKATPPCAENSVCHPENLSTHKRSAGKQSAYAYAEPEGALEKSRAPSQFWRDCRHQRKPESNSFQKTVDRDGELVWTWRHVHRQPNRRRAVVIPVATLQSFRRG